MNILNIQFASRVVLLWNLVTIHFFAICVGNTNAFDYREPLAQSGQFSDIANLMFLNPPQKKSLDLKSTRIIGSPLLSYTKTWKYSQQISLVGILKEKKKRLPTDNEVRRLFCEC